MDFQALLHDCVPPAYQERMARIVQVESTRNPYAIGVVGGKLVRQPNQLDEAVATAKALDTAGWNFSLGQAQVNKHNLASQGLDFITAFDACKSLKAGAAILAECDQRAGKIYADNQIEHAGHSCYYSGNFLRGFQPDRPGGTSYVQRVAAAGKDQQDANAIPVIPDPKKKPPAAAPPVVDAPVDEREEKPAPAKWDVFNDFSSNHNSFINKRKR